MAEQPTLGRMGQQFTDPLDSLLRCATMLWNHDSSLRVVWILFFSPYSSGTLFATPFSIVTLLFALFEPCLNDEWDGEDLCHYLQQLDQQLAEATFHIFCRADKRFSLSQNERGCYHIALSQKIMKISLSAEQKKDLDSLAS